MLLDILVFIAAVAGQMVCYWVPTRLPVEPAPARVLAGVLVALTIAFSLLSFFAPGPFLFEDPEPGLSGIPHDYEDHELE